VTDIEEDEGYLPRLLLMHPDLDPGGDDVPVVTEPAGAPAPPVAGRVPVATSAGGAHHAGPVIAYDGDGWISVVPDQPAEAEAEPAPRPVAADTAAAPATPLGPPPAPPAPAAGKAPSWWRRNVAYIAVLVIIAVVVAGMALAPGGDRPVLLSGPRTTTAPKRVDPLSQDWRLEKVNLQFNEVEEGYVQVFDGAIDPAGTDGCTQPKRADGVIATSKTAYAYRPDKLGGFAAGHVAAMITVFRDEAAAQRRAAVERSPGYLQDCLSKWDEATWFGDTTIHPTAQQMVVIPVALKGRTVVGGRYTATYTSPQGDNVPAYTDHIIVTTGRVRVWLELSSVLYPFDADRRDAIVHNILERVDKAIADA
jgi:hypothetical protein